MHVFRNDQFEIGFDLDGIKGEDIHRMFQVLRESPECSLHGEEILALEKEVWQAFLARTGK